MNIRNGLWALLLVSVVALGNDSTGYVGIGGISYIKNPHISMQSEDLYISQEKIQVAYQFKNLTNRDITETILFPLPAIPTGVDGDFADVEGMLNSFQIKVNGKAIKPKRHLSVFFSPYQQTGNKSIDVTAELAACGVSEKKLLNIWLLHENQIDDQIAACSNPTIQRLIKKYEDSEFTWEIKVTYSWVQTFKANAITHVEHRYQPLVGGGIPNKPSMASVARGELKRFCLDRNFVQKLNDRTKGSDSPLILTRELSYILTTGANWAKPIGRFTLTIERKPHELVSLCWDKSLKKINATQFRAVKTHFVPKRDLDILFVPLSE